jgi:hypothetical protein
MGRTAIFASRARRPRDEHAAGVLLQVGCDGFDDGHMRVRSARQIHQAGCPIEPKQEHSVKDTRCVGKRFAMLTLNRCQQVLRFRGSRVEISELYGKHR